MTEVATFLGGGNNPGSYNLSSVPELSGKISGHSDDTGYVYNYTAVGGDYTKSSLFTNGVFDSKIGSGSIWYCGFHSNTTNVISEINFRASRFNSIYGRTKNLNPNYYTVEFWIKFK